jgi:predicted translin family RNA/ssDNA-binding protein
LSREIIRDSARAIKDIHLEDSAGTEKGVRELHEKMKEMRKVDEGFRHISNNCYQEYAEIMSDPSCQS